MAFTPGSRRGEMADINMTPMIDVMLVLLIIFMVTAPMMTTGVDVALPQSRTGKNLESEAVMVTLTRDGKVQLEGTFLPLARLENELRAKAAASTRKRPVLVRADGTLPYERVIKVVDAIRAAGFTQVGFVTQGTLQAPPSPETKP